MEHLMGGAQFGKGGKGAQMFITCTVNPLAQGATVVARQRAVPSLEPPFAVRVPQLQLPLSHLLNSVAVFVFSMAAVSAPRL